MEERTLKVWRKMEVVLDKEVGFKVGDQIQVGRFYTATCQKVTKKGAIFCMDQYLDEEQVMNERRTNEGGYEVSYLRTYLKGFALNSMFDEIRDMMVPFKNGDLLRIPTAEEMFGPEEAHAYYEALSNKKRWPLMKDRKNRVAYRRENQEIEWSWLQNKYKYSPTYFALVDIHGYASGYGAFSSYGVRVVFQLLV